MKTLHPDDRSLEYLFHGLSMLIQAGSTPAEALQMLQNESDLHLPAILAQELDLGSPLSDAMDACGCFSHHCISMIRVGEQTGHLEEALNSLSKYYKERQQTARLLRDALTYPGLILLLMLSVIGVLLIYVLPVFDSVYASLGSRLTGVAGGLLQFGRMLKTAMPVLLILLGILVLFVLSFSRIAKFREICLALFRKRFADSGLFRLFHNARFARALAMGLASGQTLEEAVSLASTLLSDVPDAANRCRECASLLENGTSLSEAMEKTKLLPSSQAALLTVALRGGYADRIISEIADRMQENAEHAVSTVVARIEPAMVLTASLLVGSILLTVMLPLMNIMASIGG